MAKTNLPFDVDPLTGQKLQTLDSTVPFSLSEVSSLKSDYPNDPAARKAIENQYLGGLFSGAGDAIADFGSGIAEGAGKFVDFLGSRKGQAIAGSVTDMLDRLALQPTLEADALFRAFGKQAGGAQSAKQGILGASPIVDMARHRAAESLRERNEARDKRIEQLLDKIIAK
jgi:hypothetical protein